MNNGVLKSHAERISDAKKYRAKSLKRIGWLDLRGIAKFYLLEELGVLYRNDLEKALNDKSPKNDFEISSQKNQIKQLRIIVKVLDCCIQYAKSLIQTDKYSVVRKAISESALMRAQRSVHFTEYLNKIANKFDTVLKDSRLAAEINLDQFVKEQKSNETLYSNSYADYELSDDDTVQETVNRVVPLPPDFQSPADVQQATREKAVQNHKKS